MVVAAKNDLLRVIPASANGESRWSGRYIGATLGGGWGTATQHYERAGDHGTANLNTSGAAASLNAGYNWMASDNVLVGLEGDLGVMNIGHGTKTVFDGHNWSSNGGPLWGSLRGRAGYVFSDDIMAYATGGLAVASVDDTSIGNTAGETAIERGLRAGLALGMGVEYAWDDNWNVKAEFLHMDFGKANGRSANDEPYSFENNINILRVGASTLF